MTEEARKQETMPVQDIVETVREFVSMMNSGGISELDVTSGDLSIRLRTPGSLQPVAMVPVTQQFSPDVPPVVAEPVIEGHVLTSPMIGTFYAAPGPGEQAFVNVGDHVESGQVIGIIEAMKIMNEITADRTGVVIELLVENAQPVEFGSPLMRISPGAATLS